MPVMSESVTQLQQYIVDKVLTFMCMSLPILYKPFVDSHLFLLCVLTTATTNFQYTLGRPESESLEYIIKRRDRARQPTKPSINTRGKSDLMHAGRFTCWDSYRCRRGLLVDIMFAPHAPFPTYGMCSCLRTAVFSYKDY
jgi:hypothetical protein